MEREAGLTATVSVAQKVNLGNYESADVFISVSGINEVTTSEDVAALLDGAGEVAYAHLKVRLAKRVAELRAGGKR